MVIGSDLMNILWSFTVAMMTMLASNIGFFEGNLQSEKIARVNIPATAKQTLHIRVTGSGGDLDCYLTMGQSQACPLASSSLEMIPSRTVATCFSPQDVMRRCCC